MKVAVAAEAAALEAAAVEAVDLTVVQGNCIKPFVLNVRKNAKFLSSQQKANQSIAGIVSKNINLDSNPFFFLVVTQGYSCPSLDYKFQIFK